MYVISVIPISRGIGAEHLSYYAPQTCALGAIVQVPVRKRNVPALVVGVQSAKDAKAQLRSAHFAVRKIAAMESTTLVTSSLLRAVQYTARYHATTVGAVLAAAIPKALIDNPPDITVAEQPRSDEVIHDVVLFQDEDAARYSRYKALIRESFARKESVLVVVPTRRDIERLTDELARGVTQYAYALHGNITKKKIISLWTEIATETHPVLVITTPQHMSVPRHDVTTVILEHESSRAFKILQRPFIDYRVYVESYAREIGARLVLGDRMMRIETLWRHAQGEIADLTRPKMHYQTDTGTTIVDMRANDEGAEFAKKVLRLVSDEFGEMITYAQKTSVQLFVFNSRKGLFPLTVCHDCGTVVMCHQCSVPLIVRGRVSEEQTEYVCHRCGTQSTTDRTCGTCASWNLTTLGIGIELIEQQLAEAFPEAPLFRIDSSTTRTHTQIKRVIDAWRATPGGVLLGTTQAVPYVHDVAYSVIASLDSLFAIPDFAINEKIFNLLLSIRESTREHMLIQTRQPEQDVLLRACDGDVAQLYRSEIAQRIELNYPPLTIFIKVTFAGTAQQIRVDAQMITQMFAAFSPSVYPAFTKQIKGKRVMHALLEVPRDEWPDEELIQQLRELPPQYSVDVSPDTTL